MRSDYLPKHFHLGIATGVCLSVLATRLLAVESQNCDARAQALLSQMTLEEKIGQMTQVDMKALKDKADIQKYGFGSMLSGGRSDPADNRPQTWLEAVESYQAWALKTRLKIPLIYGIDAVHGHNNIEGAVIFPHHIGLGATRNPKLVEAAARVTALEVAGTGIRWDFAPCIAVAQDARWGRTYESFGESPELVSELGAAAVHGFQGSQLSAASPVLACAKHFVGDGGTRNGVDEGNTVCDEATLRQIHLRPYLPAIRAGVGSIMVSYSSWNTNKMHGHKYLLTDVLKGELGFKGFLVSDWAAIDQISKNYRTAIERSINAGLDMVMLPNGPGKTNSYVDFIQNLKSLVDQGRIPQARIDDAVRRILRVKFQLGLFEHPYTDHSLTAAIGSAQHRQVARQCVRESLVLLKNSNNALPLSKHLKRLQVVGAAADDLGIQCGGWTIDWQGRPGEVTTGGTTVLRAIRQAVAPETQVTFSADGSGTRGADAVLVVLGEKPYAEMKGDRNELNLPPADLELLQRVREAGAPVILVLLSGRPLVLGPALEASDALVAAWLPGTEGQGVADVLFGEYKPTGKLPRTWPLDNSQPLFPYGFGLTY